MTKNHYSIEKEGQIAFFDNYRIPYTDDDSILVDNTDGVYHGNIMEFKLNITNTGKVLFQAIKYLSQMRINGESVPARILLIDLNDTKVYVYNSIDYIDDIQKTYIGAASKNNKAFAKSVTPVAIYDYMDIVGSSEVQKLLINKYNDWYIPIDIDEDCIVGWAKRYYDENPKATKGDFLGDDTGKIKLKGEIRDPKHFKGLINPYTKPTNEKFKYLMDCLNDRLNKKDLGAFYTPEPYCKKAAELVEMAVARVPEGNDYIILDRCAGTGNLESALYNRYDKNGDELISHCIVSTYEYYEYKVLLERIGQDVRNIIPPTEANVEYANGKVSNADAMSKDYIDNPLIKKYIDDPKCTIILFENPPYRDISSNATGVANQQKSYVLDKMRADCSGATLNDLANRFIWSGYEFYLRQPTDSYILFSPIKYWKSCDLSKKIMLKGFLFNRSHFHATASAITCILWSNEDDLVTNTMSLEAFDIESNKIVLVTNVKIKQVSNNFSSNYYDKRTFSDDEDGICCELSGEEYLKDPKRIKVKQLANDNIIGYLRASSYNFDVNSCNLLRCGEYDAHGFYIRKDNYLLKLPLFVAKKYPMDNWYEKDIYATTSDGGDAYTKDKDFLKSCLIYTCLSNQNKCLTFTGSDGRFYRNELCFDTTEIEKDEKTYKDTVASKDLAKMELDKDEKSLIDMWNKILKEAKKTANYDKNITYGVYQITKELNTTHEEGTGKSKKDVPDYPILNGYLESLRTMLKAYYKSHITEKMFKYQLLK